MARRVKYPPAPPAPQNETLFLIRGVPLGLVGYVPIWDKFSSLNGVGYGAASENRT